MCFSASLLTPVLIPGLGGWGVRGHHSLLYPSMVLLDLDKRTRASLLRQCALPSLPLKLCPESDLRQLLSDRAGASVGVIFPSGGAVTAPPPLPAWPPRSNLQQPCLESHFLLFGTSVLQGVPPVSPRAGAAEPEPQRSPGPAPLRAAGFVPLEAQLQAAATRGRGGAGGCRRGRASSLVLAPPLPRPSPHPRRRRAPPWPCPRLPGLRDGSA